MAYDVIMCLLDTAIAISQLSRSIEKYLAALAEPFLVAYLPIRALAFFWRVAATCIFVSRRDSFLAVQYKSVLHFLVYVFDVHVLPGERNRHTYV